jgi:uncharacterized membrane protein
MQNIRCRRQKNSNSWSILNKYQKNNITKRLLFGHGLDSFWSYKLEMRDGKRSDLSRQLGRALMRELFAVKVVLQSRSSARRQNLLGRLSVKHSLEKQTTSKNNRKQQQTPSPTFSMKTSINVGEISPLFRISTRAGI